VLLDIEGTVAPVAFVYDVMFPFARNNVASFLQTRWNDPDVKKAVALVGKDLGKTDLALWLGDGDLESQQQVVVRAVHQLMDQDAKVTGLKQLQGMIWKQGFDQGQLVSELFPDVLSMLNQWKEMGLNLYIYSSGSIGAQKLFFGNTCQGDLLELFSGHFDTTSGPKKESESYVAIAKDIGDTANSICFISDVSAELDAAATAGMKTILRPVEGGAATAEHPVIGSFAEVRLSQLLT